MKFRAMVEGTLDVVLLGAVTVGLVVMTGCGSSGSGAGGGGTGPVNPSNGAKNVYVIAGSTSGASSILEFGAGSEGSVAPEATLSLPTNFQAFSVATDGSGQIYVGGDSGTDTFEILIYAAGSSGAATATRTIMTGTDTNDPTAVAPDALAVDGSGNVYVLSTYGEIGVVVYSATANGSATPTQVITPSLLAEPLGLAVDSTGNIYVSAAVETTNAISSAIYVFAPGSNANATPTRTITTPNIFEGIATDSTGDVFANELTAVEDGSGNVTGITAQIVEFASTATGAATPTRSITLPNGGDPVLLAGGLRVDGAGDVFAAVQTQAVTGEAILTSVLEYASGASGAATPITNFSSASWVNPGTQLAVQ